MNNLSSTDWANLIFGYADLGDPRRTQRLVQLASDMASNVGQSIVKASNSPAKIEGAYRFIRNDQIKPESIAESGYLQTDEIVRQRPLVLAIQDTTGLSFRHCVCDELGEVSSAKSTSRTPKGRTLYAHSTLMLDAQTEQIIGLANQDYWYRESKNQGTKDEQQNRAFKEKESYKWKRNIEKVTQRLGDSSNVIDVCDREADIYEYLDYQQKQGNRFLVRAKENRALTEPPGNLSELIDNMEKRGSYTVNVKQRGGRKARQAQMSLGYQTITIRKPRRATGQPELNVTVIVCQETCAHENPLCWVLYTSEPIDTLEDAQRWVRYYELRWRIEEFHKAWKSDGTEVEKLRLQHRDNIKRIAIIQAFIAVRLLQLQEMAQNNESAKQICCTTYVNDMTWKLLWKKTEKNTPCPGYPPSLHWFYYATARLGGWYDSKRTGRVGVKALWSGWFKLAELVESAEIIMSLQQARDL